MFEPANLSGVDRRANSTRGGGDRGLFSEIISGHLGGSRTVFEIAGHQFPCSFSRQWQIQCCLRNPHQKQLKFGAILGRLIFFLIIFQPRMVVGEAEIANVFNAFMGRRVGGVVRLRKKWSIHLRVT